MTVENSTRLSLIVDTLVSTVDVVKAQNFALQVMGTIPTVMLDQIDSAQIDFSKESIGTKVFTSKSAGINLNVISGEDDDYKEDNGTYDGADDKYHSTAPAARDEPLQMKEDG